MGHLDKLVPLLGAPRERLPRVYVSEAEGRDAAGRFALDPAGRSVVIHPGASWPWRRWPVERWGPLIGALHEVLPDHAVLVVRPPGEEDELSRTVAGTRGDVTVLPPLSIRELMAVLSRAGAYVGNDGGILHTAVALGIPTVGLFGGENDPRHWFPYSHLGPFRAVLQPSRETIPDKRGRRFPRPDATPEEVLKALLEVMAGSGS